MPKARKSLATRTPPVPSDSRAGVEDLMRRLMPDLQPIVRRLDELIRETIPDVQYAVKWKRVYYGLPDVGWMVELAAYDVSVNVSFFGGAEFNPPPPLGTTDRSRYEKVTTLEQTQAPVLRSWIEQAARVPGWKWDNSGGR